MMRVLVAGTFDILHPGHIYLLEEARKLGNVTAIIARDENVKRIKGKPTVFNEDERRLIVGSLKMVESAVLGDPDDFFAKVKEIQPDIILLGPDQGDAWLREKIEKEHLDIDVQRLPGRIDYSSTWARELVKRIYKREEI